MTKLSIIIPYHNCLELSKKLLDELKRQITNECEVIVIDDDYNTVELDKYKNKNFKIIHNDKPNKTASRPRNVGLDIYKGKKVVFIDADDMIKPYYIEKILNKIDNEQFDYCLFSWEAIGHPSIKEVIIKDDSPSWNTCVWNCIYDRDAIGNERFNETMRTGEDADFNSRVRKGKRANIEDIMYEYNTTNLNNISHNTNVKVEERQLNPQLIIYQSTFGDIGGIEKSLYEYFKALYKDYEIVFYYKEGNIEQLKRYSNFVKCIHYSGQRLICNKYICNSTYDNIADNVTSLDNYYAQVIHSDYEQMNWKYKKHPKTNIHIAVSEVAKNSIMKQDKTPCKIIYNLLEIEETKRVLRLISPTRLSWEKGYSRIVQMARRLNELKIPFIWQVFTNEPLKDNIDGLIRRNVTFDIDSYIKDSDYLIQLSNCESWGYTTAEAFELGIPVIATEYPAIYEQGMIEGVNGYVLKMDMSNLDEVIDKMYNNNLKGFSYTKKDNKQQWIDELGNMDNRIMFNPDNQYPKMAKVVISSTYTQEGNRYYKTGDMIEIAIEDRFNYLKNKGYIKEI